MAYEIHIQIPVVCDLKQKLQAAYDNGAAGHFQIEEREGVANIVFKRELSDDLDMLVTRVKEGATPASAACRQLSDELEWHDPEGLASAISALRSDSAKVQDLADLEMESAH